MVGHPGSRPLVLVTTVPLRGRLGCCASSGQHPSMMVAFAKLFGYGIAIGRPVSVATQHSTPQTQHHVHNMRATANIYRTSASQSIHTCTPSPTTAGVATVAEAEEDGVDAVGVATTNMVAMQMLVPAEWWTLSIMMPWMRRLGIHCTMGQKKNWDGCSTTARYVVLVHVSVQYPNSMRGKQSHLVCIGRSCKIIIHIHVPTACTTTPLPSGHHQGQRQQPSTVSHQLLLYMPRWQHVSCILPLCTLLLPADTRGVGTGGGRVFAAEI